MFGDFWLRTGQRFQRRIVCTGGGFDAAAEFAVYLYGHFDRVLSEHGLVETRPGLVGQRGSFATYIKGNSPIFAVASIAGFKGDSPIFAAAKIGTVPKGLPKLLGQVRGERRQQEHELLHRFFRTDFFLEEKSS